MEDRVCKVVYKLPHFVATLKAKAKRVVDLKPNRVRNPVFVTIFNGQHQRYFRQPKFNVEDRVRVSKVVYFSGNVINHCLQRNLLKLLLLLAKNLQRAK